ncbi:MAG: hypothetical protein QM741_11945 [Rudaea sp.]|uniref:hypothetical protein n=1 Tax=Rudaea sp. TaxID=2136325 RepID=UPI0039E3DDC6
MNKVIKSSALVLLAAAGLGLGGCVYYPVRTGVAYDGANGNAIVDDSDSYGSGYYAAPAYYGYYDPYWYGSGWYGWGYPSISLGFYGGYWGGHGYRGPWRGQGGGWGGRGGQPHVSAPSSHGMSHGTRH